MATCAFAQQQQRGGAAELSAARLRAHVEYLASDKLEGRRTGTQGAAEASYYIAQEFQRYGLRGGMYWPAGTKERMNAYLQKFPYVASVELGRANAMTFTSRAAEAGRAHGGSSAVSLDLRVGEDWMPLAWSTNARAEHAPVTYVGYGITAAGLGHDDYANA